MPIGWEEWLDSINEFATPRPEEPFVAYTEARVLTSNSGASGFSGIVSAVTYGYCFPHIKPRMFMDGSLFPESSSPESFRRRGAWIYEWKCVPFGFACLFEIRGGSTSEPIAFRDFGGISSPIVTVDPADGYLIQTVSGPPNGRFSNIAKERELTLRSNFQPKDWEKLLPVGDGFYKMNKFGQLTFFDADKNIVAENIPVHDDFCYVEFGHGEYYSWVFRFNDTPTYIKYRMYTPDGNVKDNIFALFDIDYQEITFDDDGNGILIHEYYSPKNAPFPPIDGYYLKNADGTFEPFSFTPLFCELKNGDFLYGVKGGKLYHKTKKNGGFVELVVGDGLKNFRLRELKKIRRAKK